mgnify:CR=1 FL=1
MNHGLLNNFRDASHLVDAHERIHFGQQFWQFLAKPLRQTAGYDQALTPVPRLPQLGRFENGIAASLLRAVD